MDLRKRLPQVLIVATLVQSVGFHVWSVVQALFNKLAPSSGRRARFVFNWQYGSYYILTMLAGARRHIVLTFARLPNEKGHTTNPVVCPSLY